MSSAAEPSAKTLGRSSSIYVGGEVGLKGIELLLVLVYTRFMSTSQYGLVEVARAVGGVWLVVCTLGLDSALGRACFDRVPEREVRTRFTTILVAMISIGSFTTLAASAAGSWLPASWLRNAPFHPYIAMSIWASYALTVPGLLLVLWQAQQRPGRYSSLQVAQALTLAAFVLYFVVIQREQAEGQIKGRLIGAAVVSIACLIALGRYAALRLSAHHLRAALAFGIPVAIHSTGWWTLNLSDRLIIEHYLPLADVGIYSLGYNLGMSLNVALAGFNRAWAPALFSAASGGLDVRQLLVTWTTRVTAGALFLALIISAFAHEIVRLMAPATFGAAAGVIPLVALAYVFIGMYQMVVNQIFYSKRTHLLLRVTLTCAAINVALNLVVVPRLGYLGAALTTLATFALLFALTTYYSLKVQPAAYDARRLVGLFLLAALLYAVSTQVHTGIAAGDMLIKGALCVGFPVVAVRIGILPHAGLGNLLRRASPGVR